MNEPTTLLKDQTELLDLKNTKKEEIYIILIIYHIYQDIIKINQNIFYLNIA